MKKLPVYKLKISEDENDDTGVFTISLVDKPAIEIDWFAFKKDEPLEFQFKSVEDKKILAGYFLVPDKLIYRKDNSGEYFVTFEKETIQKIAEKFNKNQHTKSFNIQHNSSHTTDAFVKENWVIESNEYDKAKVYGFEPIEGAWFGLVKVESEITWNGLVKEGKVNGFSVEGFFDTELASAIEKFTATKSILTKCGQTINFESMLTLGTEVELANGQYELENDMFAVVMDNKLVKLSSTKYSPIQLYRIKK